LSQLEIFSSSSHGVGRLIAKRGKNKHLTIGTSNAYGMSGGHMDSGYYAACTGLISRMDALDNIANNLANTSTNGFQARHNVFRSVLNSTSNSLSALNQDINDYGVLSSTRLDNSQGSIQHTGNDLDLAIQGPGYFAVQTSSGTLYTRAGNLRVSPKGELTTAMGDPVLGDKGVIPIVGAPVSISGDGTISVNGAVTGHLKLFEFPASTELQSSGGTYLRAPLGTEQAATKTTVLQGSLESSNVNPVTSTVEMIGAQRDVETMRRVLTLINTDMDKIAAQDLPHIS
jgi:flagellar basal-body rod protein FlgF/flagellar basal-body rod protein FlgG